MGRASRESPSHRVTESQSHRVTESQTHSPLLTSKQPEMARLFSIIFPLLLFCAAVNCIAPYRCSVQGEHVYWKNDCRRYSVCDNGLWKTRYCWGGLVYSTSSKACVKLGSPNDTCKNSENN